MKAGKRPIVEADNAFKCLGRLVPVLSWDLQSAGDGVQFGDIILQGCIISHHSRGAKDPVNFPGHSDMVWVETSGQTN